MSFTEKSIYELLPSVYRLRDAEQGEPLKALISIIAREAGVAESNIAELYENWFIETCQEWVVPYIGDLLGVRGLHSISGSSAVSQRVYVANTLRYRRRKGIAPVLEQLSLDTAGWRAHVTEFFEGLATTQYMNHIRLKRTVAPDLRRMNQLDLLDTAFDTIAHTADVRHISSLRGKYNIPNIGIFVWRVQNYPVTLSDARKVNCPAGSPDPAAHYYTFSPLGNAMQLFNSPETESGITHISEEINVPALLRRRALHDELEARRQALVDGVAPVYLYFDDKPVVEGDPTTKKHPVFEIFPDGSQEPVPPEEILICNLENCCVPPVALPYKKLLPDGTYSIVDMPIQVAVDPVNGKFVFSEPQNVTDALVSYSYGFSGDTGSGTYNRQDSVGGFLELFHSADPDHTMQIGVSKSIKSIGSETIVETIGEALALWNNAPEGSVWIINIMDNRTYAEDLEIIIKEKSQLLLISAGWPVREDPDLLISERLQGDIAPGNLRPHIYGNISVKGIPDPELKTGGGFSMNGILLEGKLSVLKGNLGDLTVEHCTLLPGKGGLVIGNGISPSNTTSNQWLKLKLRHSVTGPLVFNATRIESLEAEGCIIDNGVNEAIHAVNAPGILRASTILGNTHVKTLEASNCIFTGEVIVERRQTGCVRFCYVPGPSPQTPRRYRCQPEQEIIDRIAEAEKAGPVSNDKKNKIRKEVTEWLVPAFTSLDKNHYGYAQLNQNCPGQISSGADDGSEMGAFSFLKQPQRKANLRIALDEYLPLGLEAGIFNIT